MGNKSSTEYSKLETSEMEKKSTSTSPDSWNQKTQVPVPVPDPDPVVPWSFCEEEDAERFAAHKKDPAIWGLLTPSFKAILVSRLRQGIILLRMTEHCIGLVLKDSLLVSKDAVGIDNFGIYLTKVDNEDAKHTSNYYPSVFLRDNSTFDTYLNGKKLTKGKPVQVYYGDRIALGSFYRNGWNYRIMEFRYKDIPRSSPWQEGPMATYDDQLKGLRNELVEMKANLKAELNLRPLDQVSKGLVQPPTIGCKDDVPRSNPCWQEGSIATYDDQFNGLHDGLVEIRKLLCVKEHAELMAELIAKLNLKAELMAALKLQQPLLDQDSKDGLVRPQAFEKFAQSESNFLQSRDNDEEDSNFP